MSGAATAPARSMPPRIPWVFWLVLITAMSLGRRARAEREVEAFARVVVEESVLRSGPGIAHRIVYVAHRGETFVIESRKGAGFWLKVLLSDGRGAWVLGETVQPIAVGPSAPDRPSSPGFFAPPPLAEARGGMAILGGILNETRLGRAQNGFLELRPAFVLAPTIGFEPYVGMGLTDNGNELLYGGAFTLHLAPDWVVEPYVTMGLGGLSTFPNADQFALRKETVWAARAGGGVMLALRFRILVRLEATNLSLFTEDSYRNAQVYDGGLGVYF